MLRWMALGLVLGMAASATAAPVPKPVLDQKENERLWKSLQHWSSIELTEAVCRLFVHPDSTVPFLATKLRPLIMTKKQAERAIQKLDSEMEWEGAYEELSKLDPRLALSIEECWALAKTEKQKRRLAWVLHGEMIEGSEDSDFELVPPKEKHDRWELKWSPIEGTPQNGMNYGTVGVCIDLVEIRRSGKKWFREAHAMILLSRINTPAGWALIEAMSTGNKKAQPTYYASNAIDHRKEGKLVPGYIQPKPTSPLPLGAGKIAPVVEPTLADALRDQQLENWKSLDFEAVLEFLIKLDETVAFFKTKMWPLKLEKKRADELVAKLFGAKEADWKAAVAEFAKLDIRLAYTVQEAWELANSDDQRTKMAMVILHDGPKHCEDLANFEVQFKPVVPLPGSPRPNEQEQACLYFELTLKPGLPKELARRLWNHRIPSYAPGHFDELNEYLWNRQASAIHILDAIGTADALGLIRDLATGHPDAAPTKVAKSVLKRRKLVN